MFREPSTISWSEDSLEVNIDFSVGAGLMICCEAEIDFYCPPEEWWAARDLRKWVTTLCSQLINNHASKQTSDFVCSSGKPV